MPRTCSSLCITLLLMLAAPLASAQERDSVDALLAALAPIEQLQGDFQQRQYDDNGEELAVSSGRFRLLRPGYFAWEILRPDNQLIVAGPDYIWHFDRDLETVTRRPVGAQGMTPLQILGGDEQALRRSFAVEQTGPEQFEVIPLGEEAGFQRLSLRFSDGDIERMTVRDDLQQKVVVEFKALDYTSPLAPEDFAFVPPPGADVFYHDE
ncbi:MAG: outer-membrane lipoprotein carrier protein LolA [Halioglobus sp.]|nr:outer-membrane lipoprotein carrier protein LolA [Halioglobus sp.]